MTPKKLKGGIIPLVPKKKRVCKQNEIDEDLVEAVERARRKFDMTWTQAVVHGLKVFLYQADPAEAAKLGISPKE